MSNIAKRTARKAIRVTYKHAAKPILFKMKPDNVHNHMIKFAGVVGRQQILHKITRSIFVNYFDETLAQKICDIEFGTPIGLSAGFDKNAQIVPGLSAVGFGFVTVGSVTAQKCAGNPRPWFYRLPKAQSLVVNAGLGNDGAKIILNRIKKYSTKITDKMPIVLSVAKTNSQDVVDEKSGINDYVDTITRAKNVDNIKIIEVNISCPNAFGGEQFTTPGKLERLLSAIDKTNNKKPVFIKMPLNLEWPEFKELLEVAIKHKVAGVTIANLAKDRVKANVGDELPDTVKGNLSGKVTWDMSNNLIRHTYKNYGKKLIIIGVGGIFSAEDAYTKIKLGASLVELISGMIFHGPQLIAEINDELPGLLARDGYKHISEAIGVEVY